MKKLIPLLLCLLLCGCAAAPEDPEGPAITVAATVPSGTVTVLEEARQALETQYAGTLQAFPLSQRRVRDIRMLQEDLLVISGYGSTTLTVLHGEDLTEIARRSLDFELDDTALQIHGRSLSYLDPLKGEIVVLNEVLKENRRIRLPENISGKPILSSDLHTLFYITPSAIFAWDLDSGLHRTLKELSYESQQLVGLHQEDALLQCQIHSGGQTKTLLLRTDNGQLVQELDGILTLDIQGDHYSATFPTALQTTRLFGILGETPKALYPEEPNAQCRFFPRQQAAMTWSEAEDTLLLTCYDLTTGEQRATLTLSHYHTPKAMVLENPDALFFLAYDPGFDCDVLFRWEIPVQAGASQKFTWPYPLEGEPDLATLEACQAYADKLGSKYGISIQVWQNALSVQPWDYEFEAECQPAVLYQELKLLDQRLSQFPAELLADTASHFSSLNVGIVRTIRGTAASGSLNIATGIQFQNGSDAYVVISAGRYSEQALYHELFHVMETHILNESTAFDQWEALNPDSFSYTYGYAAPQNPEAYLSGTDWAFVDTYSMSYPKEDRARVWENALLPGNQDLFSPPILQAKLQTLCQGIRQAYGLRKSPEVFPWEQYLDESLAFNE